jgi:hypothetical protein
LDWWDRYWGPFYETIRPAIPELEFVERHSVAHHQDALSKAPLFQVHNELFLAGIPHARILGPNGVVITPDGGIIEESTWGMRSLNEDRTLTSLSLPKPERYAGRVFSVAGPSSNGYAHWIFEALPRLSFLERIPGEPPTVLISESLNSWQRESLEMLGLDSLPLVPLNDRYLEAELLLLPSFIGKTGNAHPYACNWLRSRFLIDDQKQPRRRLYITRRLARRRHVVNESELEPVLGKYGFEMIETERLTLRQQVKLFAEASIVIGTHGAGLSNILFAPHECKVFELFAPTCIRWMYYHLASVLKQEYWYLVGTTAIASDARHQDIGFDNLTVSLRHFELTLRAMLDS